MSLLVAALPLANCVTTADEPLADLKKKARTELVAYLKSVHGITSLADRYLLSDALEAYDLDVVPSIAVAEAALIANELASIRKLKLERESGRSFRTSDNNTPHKAVNTVFVTKLMTALAALVEAQQLVEILLTLQRITPRQATAEISRLQPRLPTECRVKEERGRVRLIGHPRLASLLAPLSLPERAWAIIGEWPLDCLPSPEHEDVPAVMAKLKALVSGAEGWRSSLCAWAAAHGIEAPPAQATTLRVIGKRGGRIFASVPSADLAGGLGAALCSHFGWRVDLDSPTLEVQATLNDDGLVATLSLLRRAEPEVSEVDYGLHPHVAWAAARTLVHTLPAGASVLDPMCGSGSMVLEIARGWPHLHAIGADTSVTQLHRAAGNYATLARRGRAHRLSRLALLRADACALPLADATIDAALIDLPFGVQHGSVAENATLYPAALHELGRVLRDSARAIVLTNDANLPILLPWLAASDAPLRMLARRAVPLGLQEGWFVLVERRARRGGDESPCVPGAIVDRFEWESPAGRAAWGAQRMAEAPRRGMVPAATYHRKWKQQPPAVPLVEVG